MEFTVNQKMQICKNYHDTGYFSFGSACKYLHTCDDVVSSSQMEEQAGKLSMKDMNEQKQKGAEKKVLTLEPDVCQI